MRSLLLRAASALVLACALLAQSCALPARAAEPTEPDPGAAPSTEPSQPAEAPPATVVTQVGDGTLLDGSAVDVPLPEPVVPVESASTRERLAPLDGEDALSELVDESEGPLLAPEGCEPLVAEDVALELFDDEVADLDGVSAVRCGGTGPDDPPVVEWHGRAGTAGSPQAVAWLSVIGSGADSLAVGQVTSAEHRFDIVPTGTAGVVEVSQDTELASAAHERRSGAGRARVPNDGVVGGPVPTALTLGLLPGGRPSATHRRPADRIRTVSIGFVSIGDLDEPAAMAGMARTVSGLNSAMVTASLAVRFTSVGLRSVDHPFTTLLDDINAAESVRTTLGVGVQALREERAADLVQILAPATSALPGTGGKAHYCGLADDLPSVEGDDRLHLSIVAVVDQCSLTGAHEVGHNLGAGHDGGTHMTESETRFPWASGLAVPGKARDIMSIACFPADCTRLPQFSDPDVDFVGFPGVRSGVRDEADNARVIEETSWAVSAYRPKTSNDTLWSGLSSPRAQSRAVEQPGGPRDVEPPYVPLVGDFDGDGVDDRFLYYPGHPTDQVWFGEAPDGTSEVTVVTKQVNGDYRPTVGDFDGDGYDDVWWFAPGPAADPVWWGEPDRAGFGRTSSLRPLADASYHPVAGDFDGDGRDDLLLYAPGVTPDTVWWGTERRSQLGDDRMALGIGGTYLPVVGNFDGDGVVDPVDDVFWYGPGGTADSIWWGGSRAGFGSRVDGRDVNGLYAPFAGTLRVLFADDPTPEDSIFWYAPGAASDAIWWGDNRGLFGPALQTSQPVNGDYDVAVGDFDGTGADEIHWVAYG